MYGIIRQTGPVEFGHIGIGCGSDLVYGINYKDISAVVSNSAVMRYDARRVNLTAHQLVLEEVMKHFSILPIRFSTISSTLNQNKIVAILEKEYAKFSELLDKMDRKKELGLKVMAIEEPIFKYILDTNENIRVMKAKLAHLDPDKSHYQLMKVGELVEQALIKVNGEFNNIIINMLTPLAEEVKINDKYGERMIMNAAFLIKNENESLFDNAINDLDELYGNLLSFKYVGTLPPYNFVNLVINTQET